MILRKIVAFAAVSFAMMGFLRPSPAAAQSLDGKTKEALVAALNDERRAQATYGAVLKKFGTVRPFVNIIGRGSRPTPEPVSGERIGGQEGAPRTIGDGISTS